jgi:acyl carrier protein
MPVIDTVHNQRIAQLVTEILKIDGTEMTDTSLFKEDHDADSLRAT